MLGDVVETVFVFLPTCSAITCMPAPSL